MSFHIPLQNELVAIVDKQDLDLLKLGKWYRGGSGRVELVKDHRVTLHRIIGTRMGIPFDSEIDHENRDKLDNRRSNLRPATRAQNNRNRGKNKGCVSQYKGVYPNRGKWASSIMIEGKRIWIGRFDNEIEAAKAYDAKAKELHAEFAVLNFPETLQPQSDNLALCDSHKCAYELAPQSRCLVCALVESQPDDTKRLDWLEQTFADLDYYIRPNRWEVNSESGIVEGETAREAIDAAMRKEV